MLKQIKIKGYKNLENIKTSLQTLTSLSGANASGKSNFLGALQILAKMASSETLQAAFDSVDRGRPIESFRFSDTNTASPNIHKQAPKSFSIETDICLSDSTVEAAHTYIQSMKGMPTKLAFEPICRRDLRYRIAVEILPESGALRISDEYLDTLDSETRPFIETQGEKIQLRDMDGHITCYDRHLNHTLLSMPHYPAHHPYLFAARCEFENWRFCYFEPRVCMRATNPVNEVYHIGPMGEELAACLNTLQCQYPKQFTAIEKAFKTICPNVDGIAVHVNDSGEAELSIREDGVLMPASIVSEGTLRILGILTLTIPSIGKETPTLIGLEEPENGIHPDQIPRIAEILKKQANLGQTQYIVTTHSPILLNMLPQNARYTVHRQNENTHISKPKLRPTPQATMG